MAEHNSYQYIETAFIHGGIYGDERTGAVNTPVYLTSTYKQDALGQDRGYEYSRTGNPTREALEALIAELEGGHAGFAFASGMAALTAIFSLLSHGDRILISSNVYGGTFRVLDKIFGRFGFRYTIVNDDTPDAFKAELTEDVKAILIETPANPLLTVTDIRLLAEIAHSKDVLLIVDNTFMTPYFQRPLELGADIVVHSATKYLSGHSDVIAGLAVVKNHELAEQLHFIQNATGGIQQPFDSFMLIRSLKTLGVRMDRHAENAEKIATYLSAHIAVKKVYYPGLHGAPGYSTHSKQASSGGAIISFDLEDEYSVERFFTGLKLIDLAESLGGVESLVCHPATMTHASIPKELREQVGITNTLVRLSVGIEHSEDLIFDLDQAIKAAGKQ
ncbi:MAG: PLP-dependent aspartate aminotransferase family protein [Clostridiales Family XIII bacterium]|jgi:cystathionine beta-lyase|nr:PLP-dependent aspartate aminotransferase family protein [Clostridiales Family XIII bacterium]